jgi:hypothetical protein
MWKQRVLSLEWWTKCFGGLALAGTVMTIVGHLSGVKWVVYLGIGLGCPLVALGALMLLVGVPYVLLDSRRRRRGGNRG